MTFTMQGAVKFPARIYTLTDLVSK